VTRPSVPDLQELLHLFYNDPALLGEFQEVTAQQLRNPYGKLLAHQGHMTVTVELYHGCPVDVEVLDRRFQSPQYARKILLRRQTDGQVVQFGIMRIDFRVLSQEVQQDILSERIPLGRTLIEHDVLREVELVALWQVIAGHDLAHLFAIPVGTETFGRTALIYCNGEPAVELLEIVTPAATMRR